MDEASFFGVSFKVREVSGVVFCLLTLECMNDEVNGEDCGEQ